MSKINLLKPRLNISMTDNILLDSVRKFCRDKLFHRLKSDPKGRENKDLYRKFGEIGLLGPTIKYNDCLGISNKMYGLIAKEIEYIDSGYRSMYSVQSSLVMKPIFKYGNEEVIDKYLDKLSKGEYVGCFGLTEPDSGSDASSMKTKAIYDGEQYILNGSKTWITNSPISDVLIIWAKYENKVNGFLLDRNMKGIETPEIKNKMSLNTSITGSIYLNDVKVPKENKLNIVGMKGPLSCLNDARLGISFGVLGSAEYCIETALDYGINRKIFGSYLAEKQLYQQKMADMVTEYNLAFNAAISVADKVDKDESINQMISLIKRNNCKKSLDIARKSRDILGGNGITEDYNVFRHMVNLETVNTYEGTQDIHSLIIGNYLTNYSAF